MLEPNVFKRANTDGLNLEPFLPGLPEPLSEELIATLKPAIEAELGTLGDEIVSTFPDGLWTVSYRASKALIDRTVWLIERLDRLSEPSRRYLVNHPLRLSLH